MLPHVFPTLSFSGPLSWPPLALSVPHNLQWSPSKSHHPLPLFKVIPAAGLLRNDPLTAAQKPFSFWYDGILSRGIAAPLLSPSAPGRGRTRANRALWGLEIMGQSHLNFEKSNISTATPPPFLAWHTAGRGTGEHSRMRFQVC